jgi:predicted DNA-binding ribbon-helix-helix protein
MKSPIVKRSIVIGGHKTSVSLEDAFWRGLKEIARAQRVTLSKMVADIDKARSQSNLSSALRLFVLERLRNPMESHAPPVLGDRHDRAGERTEAEPIFRTPEHSPA